MKAANDFLIVKNYMAEEKQSEIGIVIQRADKKAENNGYVVSVGELVKNKDIKEGDFVWFSSVECRVGSEDKNLVAIKESSIIAMGE